MSSQPIELGALTICSNFLGKILLQRHLIGNLVMRDLMSRYMGSFMGVFWALVHPLVLLVSYTFVFSIVFRIKPDLEQIDNFAVFLFCGILPWVYFQDTLVRSCTSVVDHGHLIRKTVFPSEILPITLVLSNCITHLIGFAILLVVLLYYNTLGWALVMLPLYLVLLMLLTLGLSWLAAALQVFLRDTAQILSVVMIFWFWFTPVFYQIKMVPSAFLPWIQVNPLSHVVTGYRRILLENALPDWGSLCWLAGWAVVAFLVGGLVFRKTKREFVDVL